MDRSTAVVITSINAPTRAVVDIAQGCEATGARFIVIGDEKSPKDFVLDGCDYFDIDRQRASGLRFAEHCPTRHYARKNIGYLIAIRDGATQIVETDDDNIPNPPFWDARSAKVSGGLVVGADWVNVYKYFTDALIWPRGLDLDAVKKVTPNLSPATDVFCPIQQGLADGDPDVDAIYRLILPLPLTFEAREPVILGKGSWCPFNSQNTTWQACAFPLLYLPYHCSFRMTDIWRGYVAQRIAWANGWSLSFHKATVFQDRNEHSIMRDFSEEVVGYLNNDKIIRALDNLDLAPGEAEIAANLRKCYAALVALGVVGAEELPLLDLWLADLAAI
jgi:hypothetical protein